MEFTENEIAAFRAEYGRGATDSQWELYLSDCKARALRPGVHSVFQLRSASEWDPDTGSKRSVKKPFWITTIGALRLIALRTKQYGGSTSPEYIYLDDQLEPTVVSQIPLPDKTRTNTPREPWAVRISVKRKDFDEPITSIVRFDSVAGTYKSGNNIVLTEMWVKRGPEQNAKCAEADALRKAFPEELGSLYLSEEIKNEEEPAPTAVTPASVVPLPPTAPPVNQQPAVPTDAPRPNEPKVEYHVTSVPATLPEHSGSVLVVKAKTVGEELNERREAARASVPDLKPASELPPPERKKGGRPKKENPVNGPAPVPGDITDEDIANVDQPRPVVDEVAEKAAAEAFVADLDPTPTKEEKDGFVARIRALTAKGAKGKDIQARILELSGVTDHNLAPVRHWKQALGEFETKPPSKELGTF